MSVSNEKVLPLKTLLKICASGIFLGLIFTPFMYFLDVIQPLRFYRSSGEQMKVKTVLYWTEMFGNKTFYFGESDIFRNCEVSACRITYDRNLDEVQYFDAILFHGIEVARSDLSLARSQKQKYIFVDLESPVTKPLESALVMNEFYNWTMTYRRDSDIPWTYGYIVDSLTKDVVYPIWARTNTAYEDLRSPKNHTWFGDKTKSVAWFVSRCNTSGLRDDYVDELKKHIDVDVYGKCGLLSCPVEDMGCYRMLESRYYFYLAFENSLCEDYVTEKLYKVMGYDVVPVVYGAANYTEFAPPGSYINVVDFPSPKHLAERLRYLIDNPEEYSKFYSWKERFSVDLSHRKSACQMCKMLHDEKSLTSSSVTDLVEWWSSGKCRNPADFLTKITQQ